jgi:hypothetical protein
VSDMYLFNASASCTFKMHFEPGNVHGISMLFSCTNLIHHVSLLAFLRATPPTQEAAHHDMQHYP